MTAMILSIVCKDPNALLCPGALRDGHLPGKNARWCAVGLLSIFDIFSDERSLARRLGAHLLRSIHAFPDGALGRIVGKAGQLMEENAIAPLTGRVCVAWFVRVSGADAHTRGRTSVIEARGVVPFTVSDETGQAIVRPHEASLLLALDVTETLGVSRRPPSRLLRFLREQGREGPRVAIDWRLSWQEGILVEGQPVAIVGRGRREADPEAAEGSYRAAPTRLVMTHGGEGDELFVSTFSLALAGLDKAEGAAGDPDCG